MKTTALVAIVLAMMTAVVAGQDRKEQWAAAARRLFVFLFSGPTLHVVIACISMGSRFLLLCACRMAMRDACWMMMAAAAGRGSLSVAAALCRSLRSLILSFLQLRA